MSLVELTTAAADPMLWGSAPVVNFRAVTRVRILMASTIGGLAGHNGA
jgi:hypothetical protein